MPRYLRLYQDVHEIIDWKQIETTLSHLYASKRGVPALVPFGHTRL